MFSVMRMRAAVPTLLTLCLHFIIVATAEDYYQVLGVARDASDLEIKRNFKRLVMAKHPDRNKHDPHANDVFMRINRAYEVLKNPDMRYKYDMEGEAGVQTHEEQGQAREAQKRFNGEDFGLYDEDTEIVKLTPDTFYRVRESKDVWFVNFFSPHCFPCVDFAPTWREVAHELEDVVRIGVVDCHQYMDLCTIMGVPSLPSLVFYPKDERVTVEKTKDSLIKAALQYVTGMPLIITDTNSTEILHGDKSNWLISFCDRDKDCLRFPTLQKLSVIFRGLVRVCRADCRFAKNLCKELNPDITVSARLFLDSNFKTGYDVHSLHTQDTALTILFNLPAVPVLTTEEIKDLQAALFEQKPLSHPYLVIFATETKALDLRLKKLPYLLESTDIRVVSANCTDYKTAYDFCSKLGITKHPTFMLLRSSGDFEIHHGSQSYIDIRRFAELSVKSSVSSLTPATYQQRVINRNDTTFWFVDFFAPWCPPCMAALPDFHTAAQQHQEDFHKQRSIRVNFGTVDCSQFLDFCREQKIKSYPSFWLFSARGETIKFGGRAIADEMMHFMEAFINPAGHIFTAENFASQVDLQSRQKLWLVLFHSPTSKSSLKFFPQIHLLAKLFLDHEVVRVGVVDCSVLVQVCKDQKITKFPTIRVFPMDLEKSESQDYRSPFKDLESISAWVHRHLPHYVFKLGLHNFHSEVVDSDFSWVVLFSAPWCHPCMFFQPRFEAMAKELHNHVHFGSVDCDDYNRLCVQQKIKSVPTLVIYQKGKVVETIVSPDADRLRQTLVDKFPVHQPQARIYYPYRHNAAEAGEFDMFADDAAAGQPQGFSFVFHDEF